MGKVFSCFQINWWKWGGDVKKLLYYDVTNIRLYLNSHFIVFNQFDIWNFCYDFLARKLSTNFFFNHRTFLYWFTKYFLLTICLPKIDDFTSRTASVSCILSSISPSSQVNMVPSNPDSRGSSKILFLSN